MVFIPLALVGTFEEIFFSFFPSASGRQKIQVAEGFGRSPGVFSQVCSFYRLTSSVVNFNFFGWFSD